MTTEFFQAVPGAITNTGPDDKPPIDPTYTFEYAGARESTFAKRRQSQSARPFEDFFNHRKSTYVVNKTIIPNTHKFSYLQRYKLTKKPPMNEINYDSSKSQIKLSECYFGERDRVLYKIEDPKEDKNRVEMWTKDDTHGIPHGPPFYTTSGDTASFSTNEQPFHTTENIDLSNQSYKLLTDRETDVDKRPAQWFCNQVGQPITLVECVKFIEFTPVLRPLENEK